MIKVAFFDIGNTLVTLSPPGRGDWIDGAEQVLDDLLARGVKLGIISNTQNLTRTALLGLLPANSFFDRFEPTLVILSSETDPHTQKPERAIFELALDRAAAVVPGLELGECLFCVEKLSEAIAASAAGLATARVLIPSDKSDIGTLPTVLRDLGFVSVPP
jgi:FMN phosphatase YigB (HAD superfamily)